jgi:hypothetical protein
MNLESKHPVFLRRFAESDEIAPPIHLPDEPARRIKWANVVMLAILIPWCILLVYAGWIALKHT